MPLFESCTRARAYNGLDITETCKESNDNIILIILHT